MASIQERLQKKREPLDKWSTREQLCLAFAVARSGDQNWMSVSRALKPFGEPNRPSDWFHQKNCAAQYGALLENVETPKRKKRACGTETVIETPSELILSKLIFERKAELNRLMEEERTEYLKLQEDMALLKSGNITEEQLDLMCKQIDEEEQQKERETVAHIEWLKERELRKQALERVWRTVNVNSSLPVAGQKRKTSDSIGSLMDAVDAEVNAITTPIPETSKPALSPLLTSLLKSPSHSQNVTTSSILHTFITSQRTINSNTNPTIASLLNSSASVQVSPGLQQLVSTAISQEPASTATLNDPITDLLDASDTLPNLKAEDIESTIFAGDVPLSEIKNEEVDVFISDLIENADIVTDPEQHLLDGNNDIITDLENGLEELLCKEKAVDITVENKPIEKRKGVSQIDPFEFKEEVYEPAAKLNTGLNKQQTLQPLSEIHSPKEIVSKSCARLEDKEIKKEVLEESSLNSETVPGSVEIVEVLVIEDDDINKELDKSQIEDIVHTTIKSEETKEEITEEIKTDNRDEENKVQQVESISEVTSELFHLNIEKEPIENEEDCEEPIDLSSKRNRFTPEYSGDIFDDIKNEIIKLEKSHRAKRDYSRTKKREESDFDILLAVEEAINVKTEEENGSSSEKEDDKKSAQLSRKIKGNNEFSSSPSTEEDEINNLRSKRRYSTSGTPSDSVPNSPGSSLIFDDDRDYRNWKKSIMLVYSRLATHKYASLFLKPITEEQAPGYHNLIKRAMDLQTIRKNIENGTIRTTVEFQRDVLLMFNNAIIYNKTNDTVYNMAFEMQQEGIEQFKILSQAQQNDTPIRRETRTSEGPGNKWKRLPDDNILKIKKRKED